MSYEKGDDIVQLKCTLVFKSKSTDTILIISQSDFNRILSKVSLTGFEMDSSLIHSFYLGDGTEIVEYNFSKANNLVTIQNFNFNHTVKQISA